MAAFVGGQQEEYMTGLISSRWSLKFEDFKDLKFLLEGGYGKVYSAVRKSDGFRVALKFFGYTRHRPDLQEIRKEVALMIRLDKVDGVCQFVGVFNDTPEGLIPDKFPKFQNPYPVIVMELLEGGDMFNRISTRQTVTENYLAETFLSAMWALRSIHERGYVHRDLKLDNLMLISGDDPSPVKIIDFGMMVYLPYPELELRFPNALYGTDGYFAPETLRSFCYSYKTDIWQAGCILYAMLAGHPPFHPDVKYRSLLMKGKYYPMKGPNWDKISPAAKDLVSQMLKRDPNDRINMDGICSHPWLVEAQSRSQQGDVFSEAYSARIKNLVLKNKLKKCFDEDKIEASHKDRRANFQRTLSSSVDNPLVDSSPDNKDYSVGIVDYVKTTEYNAKLLKVRAALVQRIYSHKNGDGSSSLPNAQYVELDFEEFCKLMNECGLSVLATSQVFAIFDVDGNGSIDVKEFLLALISLRKPSTTDEEEKDAAQLYFSVFDLNEDGHICKEEMALVVDCLLHDGAGHVFLDDKTDIEEMFHSFDTDGNGVITFEEFKIFYNAILAASTTEEEDE